MTSKSFIVVGLGYGDEGKGLATDYLCRNSENPVVVRYNGGHQAGHTVCTKKGERHVFSSFGSGTLRNVPTYWSRFCTFCPAYLLYEYQVLPVSPRLFVDYLCPVTTHYDVLYNRALEATRGKNKYGSCGVGFGATIDRHNDSKVKLTFGDLLSIPRSLKVLQEIREYYKIKVEQDTSYSFGSFGHDIEDQKFERHLKGIHNLISKGIITPIEEKHFFTKKNNWKTYIFEGAQGILLDKNFGTPPYITKSNTTSHNAIELLTSHHLLDATNADIFYISRAYQTRHGNGPFSLNKPIIELKNNELETNRENEFQGEFRTSHLSVDKLNYALCCDSKFASDFRKHLIVTCMDQITTEKLIIYKGGMKMLIPYVTLPRYLECDFSSVKYSFSRYSEDLC